MKEIDTFGYNLTTSYEKVLFHIFKALDNRISEKADKAVANDNVQRDMEYHRALDKRLTALEKCWISDYGRKAIMARLDSLEAHDKCQNCAESPYIEAEKKPPFCCKGCGKFPCENPNPRWMGKETHPTCYRHPAPDPDVVCEGCADEDTCDQSRSNLCNIGVSGHPPCYREKKTCGDCVKPWRKKDSAWVLCDCVPGEESHLLECHPDGMVCPNFEAIQ